jgi:hypothetical protein
LDKPKQRGGNRNPEGKNQYTKGGQNLNLNFDQEDVGGGGDHGNQYTGGKNLNLNNCQEDSGEAEQSAKERRSKFKFKF